MSKDYFSYNRGENVIPEKDFRISPSQLSRFLDNTNEWYREFLLGETFFTGNTATHLGTCVHAAAEMYVDSKAVDHQAIQAFVSSIKDPEVDKNFILGQYPVMAEVLINDYLADYIPSHTELFLHNEVLPSGIHIGGSLDSLYQAPNGNLYIVDYKTTSAKSPPTRMSRSYYFQQLAYAWMARKLGHNVSHIRLVFVTTNDVNRISEKTGKPMKDYPSTANVLDYEITDTDMEIIDNTIKLVAHSVKIWKEQPDLRYLLAQDFRLYKPPRKLFKN